MVLFVYFAGLVNQTGFLITSMVQLSLDGAVSALIREWEQAAGGREGSCMVPCWCHFRLTRTVWGSVALISHW